MKGKTTIVIAHRLSTIRKMDRIIVMQDGGVLEEGTHEALIRKEGSLYRKLWDLQAGGFIR
jgi:ABC-type multidrug transport system fused ATPase/permease subunit